MPPPGTDISARVKAQYEAFPYPHYGLFLPLRTQEAYASNSLFAARLLDQAGQVPALRRPPVSGATRILLAGCGDVFPYMAAAWEPRRHRLLAVDLSSRSLRRARLRCLPRLRSLTWRQGSLEDPDFPLPDDLAHIDCYGVLHHLADPARALGRLGRHLLPGGTLRLMVYNSESRGWIRQVQKAFALLGLSAFNERDRSCGRDLLLALADVSPAFRERIAPLHAGAWTDASRFVDTFFHAREARLDLDYWLRAIDAAGLRVLGVLDRYGELDDLPNPLLQAPDPGAWQERLADRRFENNFELYLAKPGLRTPQAHPGAGGKADGELRGTDAAGSGMAARLPSWHALHSPPRTWFEYEETRTLPMLQRHRIWRHFLHGLTGRVWEADAWAGALPPEALQRLGRIGALFPDDFRSRELQDLLRRPRHAVMEPPDYAPMEPLRDAALRERVAGILEARNRPRKVLELVLKRLETAQRP